jgi:hypothetical protein
MLKDDEPSIYLVIGLILIQFLQLLYYSFHPLVVDSWNSPIADGIKTGLQFFHLVSYFENANFSMFIVIFYVIFGIMIFAYGNFFMFSHHL